MRVEQITLNPSASPAPGQAVTAAVTFRNTGTTPSPRKPASLIGCTRTPVPFKDRASGRWSILQQFNDCTNGAGAEATIGVPALGPGQTATVTTPSLPVRDSCSSAIAVKHAAGSNLDDPAVAGTTPIFQRHLARDRLKRKLTIESIKLETVYTKKGKKKIATSGRTLSLSVRLDRNGLFNVAADRVTVAQCRGDVCFLKHSEPVAAGDFTRTPGKDAVNIARKTFTATLAVDSHEYYGLPGGAAQVPNSVRVAYEDVRGDNNFLVVGPCEDQERVKVSPLK